MNILNIFTARAATALIVKNDKVLLLKRSHSAKTYANSWQLPEGKIRLFEIPNNTLIRELNEEIGYKSATAKYLGTHFVFVFPRFLPIPVCRYIFRVSPPKKIDLSYEHSDFKWATKINIKTLKLVPGTEDVIKKFLEV